MAASAANQSKTRVLKLEDERAFYSLIEKRLKEEGYQLLDTFRKITETIPFDKPRLSGCN